MVGWPKESFRMVWVFETVTGVSDFTYGSLSV